MENKSWTVTYRNRDNGQRITAAVFAVDQQQAREKAKADGREAWEVESIEPNEETLARILIAEFAKKQSGHFACPRCGKMTMDAESVTRNALSRRVGCYICDTCGTVEALEDFAHKQGPLSTWAIVREPERWHILHVPFTLQCPPSFNVGFERYHLRQRQNRIFGGSLCCQHRSSSAYSRRRARRFRFSRFWLMMFSFLRQR